MLNIEMHGPWGRTAYAGTPRSAITDAFSGACYRGDVQINSIGSWCLCPDGTDAPFLRLLVTPNYLHLEDALQRLHALNLDIEVVVIKRFIPRT